MSLTPSTELNLDPWNTGWQVVKETDLHWHLYRNTGYMVMNFAIPKARMYGSLAEVLLGWLG